MLDFVEFEGSIFELTKTYRMKEPGSFGPITLVMFGPNGSDPLKIVRGTTLFQGKKITVDMYISSLIPGTLSEEQIVEFVNA